MFQVMCCEIILETISCNSSKKLQTYHLLFLTILLFIDIFMFSQRCIPKCEISILVRFMSTYGTQQEFVEHEIVHEKYMNKYMRI